MSQYTASIMADAGCTAEQAEKVEEYMRCEYRTLDNISRARFKKVARECFECVKLDEAEAA